MNSVEYIEKVLNEVKENQEDYIKNENTDNDSVKKISNVQQASDSFERIPKRDIKEFVEICMEYYDEEKGLSPIKDLTKQDIIKGIKLRLKERPDVPFTGDTLDREEVASIILRWRK
jgi:hypothetical protein